MTPQTPQAPQIPQGVDPVSLRVTLAAMKVIYSTTEMAQNVVGMVKSSQDPAQGLAHAATVILQQLAQQVKGVPPQAVFKATEYVVVAIYELCVRAGVLPAQGAEQIAAKAVQLAQSQAAAPAQGAAAPQGAVPTAPAPQGGAPAVPQPQGA